MKVNATLVTALVLLHGNLAGQTLDRSNSAPVPGDSYTVQRGDYVIEGPSGTSQTWDHSDLSSLGPSTITYVTPASTGFASSFPGATVAQPITVFTGTYEFYNASDTGLFELGSQSMGNTLFYNNSELLIPFPCSYATTWTDDFSSTYDLSGQPAERTGTISGEADGTGTLIMPFGTVQNVIRVHITESFQSVLDGTPYFDYSSDHYLYYRPGFHYPILGIYQTISSLSGTQQQLDYSQWVDGADVSVQDLLSNSIGIDVFPNPANEELSINFGSAGGAVVFEVIDVHGRKVQEEVRSAVTGVDQQILDVSDLSSGVYHLVISSLNGDRGVRRFVVN